MALRCARAQRQLDAGGKLVGAEELRVLLMSSGVKGTASTGEPYVSIYSENGKFHGTGVATATATCPFGFFGEWSIGPSALF